MGLPKSGPSASAARMPPALPPAPPPAPPHGAEQPNRVNARSRSGRCAMKLTAAEEDLMSVFKLRASNKEAHASLLEELRAQSKPAASSSRAKAPKIVKKLRIVRTPMKRIVRPKPESDRPADAAADSAGMREAAAEGATVPKAPKLFSAAPLRTEMSSQSHFPTKRRKDRVSLQVAKDGAAAAEGQEGPASDGASLVVKKRRRAPASAAPNRKQLSRAVFGGDSGDFLLPEMWMPGRGEEGGAVLELEGFGFDAAAGERQTVALRATVRISANRYSANIGCWGGEGETAHVLLHFNPRPSERSVVLNNREPQLDHRHTGWGRARRVPQSMNSPLFGGEITLVVQVAEDAFHIFYLQDGAAGGAPAFVHCASFPHRTGELDSSAQLFLQLPDTDDAGKREEWVVHDVWWGSMGRIATDDSIVADFGAASESRQVRVTGLPELTEEQTEEVDAWLDALQEHFQDDFALTGLDMEANGTALMEFETIFEAYRVFSTKRTVYIKDTRLTVSLESRAAPAPAGAATGAAPAEAAGAAGAADAAGTADGANG